LKPLFPQRMKPKYVVALVLVLVGTNLFTYATARYWTTQHVLRAARQRVVAAQEKHRAGERRLGQTLEDQIQMAVNNAGGLYYWWNDGLLHWGVGGLLVISGILVTRLEPRRGDAG
jgi:hypothetical protein